VESPDSDRQGRDQHGEAKDQIHQINDAQRTARSHQACRVRVGAARRRIHGATPTAVINVTKAMLTRTVNNTNIQYSILRERPEKSA
jgi:hypothetical protein